MDVSKTLNIDANFSLCVYNSNIACGYVLGLFEARFSLDVLGVNCLLNTVCDT